MLRPGSLDEAKRTISSYQPARWDDTFETVWNSVQELRKNSEPDAHRLDHVDGR